MTVMWPSRWQVVFPSSPVPILLWHACNGGFVLQRVNFYFARQLVLFFIIGHSKSNCSSLEFFVLTALFQRCFACFRCVLSGFVRFHITVFVWLYVTLCSWPGVLWHVLQYNVYILLYRYVFSHFPKCHLTLTFVSRYNHKRELCACDTY